MSRANVSTRLSRTLKKIRIKLSKEGLLDKEECKRLNNKRKNRKKDG